MDETKMNDGVEMLWLLNVATVPLPVFLFLEDKVYPVFWAVGAANVTEPEGMVSYIQTM